MKSKAPRRATINDVATLAKTGKTSVSRYLNGEQDLLSEDLRERIAQAISTLRYYPNQMARGLKRGHTRLIGLIIADITNPYSVDVLSSIEAACRTQGFTLLVCNTNNEVNQEQRYLELLHSYQVEGIVINAIGMREEALNHLQQSTLPMVLIDRKIDGFDCDMVGLDNAHATALACQHLVTQGFDALLFLSEPLGTVNTRRERLRAFQAFIAAHPELVSASAETPLTDDEYLDHILRQFRHCYPDKRMAVISANGALTLKVVRALRRLGWDWGHDLGLLGFDELVWAEFAGVGITTLKQPTRQIGQAALERVLSRIGSENSPGGDLLFQGELIVRGSTT